MYYRKARILFSAYGKTVIQENWRNLTLVEKKEIRHEKRALYTHIACLLDINEFALDCFPRTRDKK